MKLMLQIALGVFLGSLSSQLTMEAWHAHQEAIARESANKLNLEQEKARLEQGERIRALLLQGRKLKEPDGMGVPPAGFVPDDARDETLKHP